MIAWITALLLCLPPTFLGIPKSVFAPLIITFGYLIPLVIVIFCYSSILKGLYFDRKILAEKVTDEARLREKKCLVRGLVVITLVFLACNLPKIVIIYGLNYDIQNRSSRRIAFVTLECLSSSINPYLYALHSENYRSQVKQLFCRKKERRRECKIITRRFWCQIVIRKKIMKTTVYGGNIDTNTCIPLI